MWWSLVCMVSHVARNENHHVRSYVVYQRSVKAQVSQRYVKAWFNHICLRRNKQMDTDVQWTWFFCMVVKRNTSRSTKGIIQFAKWNREFFFDKLRFIWTNQANKKHRPGHTPKTKTYRPNLDIPVQGETIYTKKTKTAQNYMTSQNILKPRGQAPSKILGDICQLEHKCTFKVVPCILFHELTQNL